MNMYYYKSMAIVTTQQITHYYDQYRDTEIIFSKDIIKTLALDPRQIYIKTPDGQWPCIINSTSFIQAKIIVGTKGGAYEELSKDEPPLLNLRLCFMNSDGQPVSFLVPCKVDNVSAYMNSSELAVVTLSFTQRPPDALIELTGKLLEANENAVRRRDERIPINEDSKRKLGLVSEKISINVQGLPRNCVLRDLSFCGAKAVLMGLAQFLTGKEATLSLDFTDPSETVTVKGTIVSAEPVEGRKDIVTANISFADVDVPLEYKLHINEYVANTRKRQLSSSEQHDAQRKLMEERAKRQAEIAAQQAQSSESQ